MWRVVWRVVWVSKERIGVSGVGECGESAWKEGVDDVVAAR